MSARVSDSKKFYFRSDRFVKINGNWFFSTREGTLEGPFVTQKDAVSAAQRYAKLLGTRFFNTKEISSINNLQMK